MARWIVLALVVWAACAQAEERLEIEVVAISLYEETAGWWELRLTEPNKMVTVHKALSMLGVAGSKVNVVWDRDVDDFAHLRCTSGTILAETSCYHAATGEFITDWLGFAKNLNDQVPPPGTVQLFILSPNRAEFVWNVPLLGAASRWWWGLELSERHWSNTACRAWAIHDVAVIAHELGHCFQLIHNEDDTDWGIDVMHSSQVLRHDFLKDSNQRIISHHFRREAPAARLAEQPLGVVEFH